MNTLKNLSAAAFTCGVSTLLLAQGNNNNRPGPGTPNNRPGAGGVNDGPAGGSNLTLYIVVAVVVIAVIAFFALRGKKK
jgi:hypothetical protein